MVNFKSRAKFCKFDNYVYVVDILKTGYTACTLQFTCT